MAQEPNRIGDPFNTETEEERLRNDSDDVALSSYDTDLTTDNDETDETRAIREDIENTRSQMSETIDAIQDKLSFANISGQVKEEVSEQISSAITTAKDEVSDHISNVFTSAKDTVYDATRKAGRLMKNAEEGLRGMNLSSSKVLPIALIGTGVTLLVMNNRRKSSGNRYNRYQAAGSYDRHTESARESSGAFDSVRSKAGDAVGSITTSVRGAADTAYRAIGDGTGAITEKVSTLGTKSVESYQHYMDVNPLAVGAVAAVVGAALGMAVPKTRYEGELMGDASQRLMSQVQGTAKDALSKVQDVAERAAGAITETEGGSGAQEKSQGASQNRM